MKERLLSVVVFISLLGIAAPSEASSERELTYRYHQIWGALIRFLRVDQNFPISEKDKKSGYILFQYKAQGRTLPGAIELIPMEKNNKRTIRLSLRIAEMPTYVESVLTDKLVRKLKNEYGPPPKPRLVVAPEGKSVKSSDEEYQESPAPDDPPGDEDGNDAKREGENLEEKQE